MVEPEQAISETSFKNFSRIKEKIQIESFSRYHETEGNKRSFAVPFSLLHPVL